MKRNFIFSLHSIAGLLSGIFILIMSVSGSVLVFHEEIDELQYPAVVPKAAAHVLAVDSCYKSLQTHFPGAQISNCHLPASATSPFLFSVYDTSFKQGKEALRIFMHPQTAEILDTRGAKASFTSWMDTLHGSLHLGKTGEWLLGFFSIVFVISLITGTILYRRSIRVVMSFRKRVFRTAHLHQLIGVYALLFNLVIAITGFWMQRYVFKKSFYQSYNYTPVVKASPALAFSLDSALKATKENFPYFTAHVIYFSQSATGTTAIYGSRSINSFIHSKKYADMIALDGAGAIAYTRFVNEIDPADRYDIINSQIHHGKYGGWPVKLIYCLFGLTSAVLSITGFIIWYRRKRKRI